MLAIRMKRTGRRGHAQFRVVVQDSHFHPTRGKIVAYIGSYDPHAKTAVVDKELAQKYLSNGAQPSDRVAKLLKAEGVKLPAWVKVATPGKRTVRNPEKRRSTRPPEPEAPAEAPAPAEDAPAEEPAAEVEAPAETPAVADTAPEAEESPAVDAPTSEDAPEQSPEAKPE